MSVVSVVDQAYFAFLERKLEERPGAKKKIYFLGVPNAGKSSLFNRWLGQETAQVSAKPEETKEFLAATRYGLTFIDTPPLGISSKQDEVILNRCNDDAAIVVYLLSGTSGISVADVNALKRLKVPYVVAVNRMDRLDPEEADNILGEIEEKVGIERENIVLCSAKSGSGEEGLAFKTLSCVASADEVRQCFPDAMDQKSSSAEALLRRARQFRQRYGKPPRILMTGIPNAGKSQVLNALVNETVQPVTARPKSNPSFFQVSRWGIEFVEAPPFTPEPKTNAEIIEKGIALAHLVIHIVNGPAGFTNIDRSVCSILRPHRPFILVINKIDVLDPDEKDLLLGDIRKEIEDIDKHLLLLSASKKSYLPTLIKQIGIILGQSELNFRSLSPDLAEQFQQGLLRAYPKPPQSVMVVSQPKFRADTMRRARRVVRRNAALAAGCAVIPLPIADIGPILAIQAEMVLELAFIFGQKISLKRAREIVTTVAGGVAIKGISRALIRFAPLIGPVISSATVYAGTTAMGEIAIHYFKAGMKESIASLKEKYEKMAVSESEENQH